MKFKCDRDVFSEALQTVQRAVSSRPGIPALTGVLMNASGKELVLATTDLEVSARLRLEVQVQEEGVALIPARLLADMVKSFEQAPVILEAEGGQARIVCSNYEGTVRCLPAEDFPAPPAHGCRVRPRHRSRSRATARRAAPRRAWHRRSPPETTRSDDRPAKAQCARTPLP